MFSLQQKNTANRSIPGYPGLPGKMCSGNGNPGKYASGTYQNPICIPQRESPVSIYGPCGRYCNNYEAEVIAIKKTVEKIEQGFKDGSMTPTMLVILTDSQSALEAIENHEHETSKLLELLLETCHNIIQNYGIELIMQWIPGNCGILGNEKADALAKLGSKMPQPDEKVTYRTAKTLAKKHSRNS